MGLFSLAPRKSMSDAAGSTSFGGSHHLSARELHGEVRRDLHARLGEHKGEQIFEMLSGHLDKDHGSTGVSGHEIESTLTMLQENHSDNLHSRDIEHVREVLGKHFND
ncbi:MAG: hypothetical protein KBA91_00655 [Candidatus Moranbacteria bacterium]|jgi:hypothetical protein|nr:hypothetical protein [Candidatus Moranbacteria bacterium]